MPDVGGIAGTQLKSFIERIERLEDEKRVLGQDIKEVYAEAKGSGLRGGKSGLIATGIRCAARPTARSNRVLCLGEVRVADKAS